MTNTKIEKEHLEVEEIVEILPHLILGNIEELYNNPDGKMGKSVFSEMKRVILKAHNQALLTAYQQGKKDRDKEVIKETQKAMAEVVSVLHKEFCYTNLATEEQWNESIAPKLKELQNIISGFKKDKKFLEGNANNTRRDIVIIEVEITEKKL